MGTPDLCTEQEIKTLVHAFYAKVRRDEVLGPIFNHHVDDWDHHLAKLVDFWSSVLLGTRRFSGTPMAKHVALPELSAELFQRWLMLFQETTSLQPNHAMGERAHALAQRIAQSLWYGYQISRCPHELPADLNTASESGLSR
jgi:hemoglobin